MAKVEIEIDGKKLEAEENAMLIKVADQAGIYIPRFCYHKELKVAANCRMCLVEVEKQGKPLPACATPVSKDMKVFTRSAKAIAAQKAVMEFLLINHPLDCPICDQGGECELQDLSMGYGSDRSHYCEGKRSVKDENLGPLISTDMTRCIQCTRCVRFGEEVAGFRELGAVGRGEDMEISTYVKHAMQSVVSGNIIDLCPVGALTSKPYRFTARAWELQQHSSIAPHDCVGSNIHVHTRNGKVMRVVPQENDAINKVWLSDRDRFSYEALYHIDRLEKPMMRHGDTWQEVEWQTALEYAAKELIRVVETHGGDQLAALASPNSTVEEFYLLQKLLRSLGSSHIDHRLRQVDFADQENMPVFPGLNMTIAEIEKCDVILLVGTNIQREQPLLSLHVRKAATSQDAKVLVVNMYDYDFHFKTKAKKIAAPHEFVEAVGEIANGMIPEFAQHLVENKKIAILLGAQALNHPEASQIRAYVDKIAKSINATVGWLTEGANAAGAWIAGAVPHRESWGSAVNPGLDAQAICQHPRKGLMLLNVEPDLDCANPVAAINALDQAEFIVALSIYKNPVLEQYADIILPMAAFTETPGTFVNTEGKWQSFKEVAEKFGESRPAWKILRVLGNFLGCKGFDYGTVEEVRKECAGLESVAKLVSQSKSQTSSKNKKSESHLSRIGEIPIYAGDSLVRRAKALQATQAIIEGNLAAIHMHPQTAARLQIKETEPVIVKQEDGRARLPVFFDELVPLNAVYIAGGITASSGLSQLFGPVEIQKA